MTSAIVANFLVLATQFVLLLSAVLGIFVTMRHKLNHIHIDLNSRLTQLISAVKAEGKAEGMVEGRLLGVASAEKHFRLAGAVTLIAPEAEEVHLLPHISETP